MANTQGYIHDEFGGGYKNLDLLRRTRRNLAGASSRTTLEAELDYNGFQFPPIANVRATIVPEYGEDGRSIKYHTLAITVDAVITPFKQYTAGDNSDKEQGSIDIEMETIRARLLVPGQPLNILLQGLGEYHINSETGQNTSRRYKDIDYGPKPQVLEWEPITSQAAKIQWLVTARIIPCGNTNIPVNGIYGFSYDTTWAFDNGGWLTRTVNCTGDIAASRTPQDGKPDIKVDMTSAKKHYDLVVKTIRTAFPRLDGFHRTENINISKDKKKIVFTVTDTEIQTNEPYPRGVVDIDFTESISSSLEKGFTQWDWELSGSVEVPRVNFKLANINPKQLAYSSLAMIVEERLKRNTETFKRQKELGSDDSLGDKDKRQVEVARIPQKIRIENSIYGTSLSINVSYLLICPMTLAIAASGIMEYVRVPGFTWENWRKQLEAYGIGTRDVLSHLPNYDIVVDFCHPLTSPTDLGVGTRDSDSRIPTSRPQSLGYKLPKKESTWLDYKNKFYFLTENYTVVGATLSEAAKESKEIIGGIGPWEEDSLIVDPRESAEEKEKEYKPDLETSSNKIMYIVMEGSAIRLGYGINAPKLQSVGGAECIEVGKSIISPQTQPTGLAVSSLSGAYSQPSPGENQVNINRLYWKKMYAIRGTVKDWSINTNGDPSLLV